jgi:hypothetical protein
MTAPPGAPVDERSEPATGETFTYRWGARSVGISPLRKFGRTNGLVVACFSLFFFYLGITMFKSYGRTAWLPIGIAVATMLGGIGMMCQKKPDIHNAPIERLIRIWYSRGIVEFRYCPFFTSFWKQTIIDGYECPVDDVLGFTLSTEQARNVGLTFVESSAILRIWTKRGYLVVTGEVPPLKKLLAALRAAAGDKPAPLVQRNWAIMLIIFVAAALVIAVLWHFQII